jgi:hypothetical protein
VSTTAKKPKKVWLVVQQGGSSAEMYVYVFDSKRNAKAYRRECDRDAGYQTSEPIETTEAICAVLGAVEEAVQAAAEMAAR